MALRDLILPSFVLLQPRLIKLGCFLIFSQILLLPALGYCEDTAPPINTSININSGEAYTTSRSTTISLSANDPGGGVTGYYLSEDSSALSGGTLPAFSTASSTQIFASTASFTLSESEGSKTVYAWFKDDANNISSVTFDSITLDTTAPADGLIRVNNDAGSVSSSQVTVTVSATDNFSIAGYRVSESSSSPNNIDDFTLLDTPVVSLNTNFTFNLSASSGTKTLYAWFIDGAGNISPPATYTVDFDYGWFRFYDIGDESNIVNIAAYSSEMTMDDSGNLYVVGLTPGDLGGDENTTLYGSAFVSKLNSAGDVLWSRLLQATDSLTAGHVYSSKGEHIAVDSDGNVFIAGGYDYTSLAYPDGFLAKFDSDGNQLWLKVYSRSEYSDVVYIRDIDVDAANNVYLLGYTSETVELSDTVTITNTYDQGTGKFLAKYGSSGNLLWGISSEELVGQGSMAVDSSGNIFMAGASNSSDDLQLSRFNSSGTNIWSREWGIPGYQEYCEALLLDSSDNLYVTGFAFPDGTDVTSNRAFVGKFDNSGDAEASGQWYELLDLMESSDQSMEGESIALDSKGNVYIAGNIRLGADQYGTPQSSDMFVRKYDMTGTEIWTKRLGDGGIEGETADSVCIGSGDFVYLLGDQYNHNTTPGFAGQKYDYNLYYQDMFIWKSSSDSQLDLTLPTGSLTINNGATAVIGNVVTLNLTASDDTGITGYYVSETDMIPSPGIFTSVDEATEISTDVQYSFDSMTTGTKTLYVWYRDASGNFSNPRATASIEMTGDTVLPVGETPIIDGGAEESDSPTISVEIAATDNVAVTGYYVTDEIGTPSANDFIEIATPAQSFSKTVPYTLTDTSPGSFFVYVYFIDEAGNISNSVQQQGDLADVTAPETTVTPASGYYDGPITVTLTATDDYYVLFTRYVVESENVAHVYSDPFEVTPPDRIAFLSEDLDGNVETVQILSYGLEQSFSGSVSATRTENVDFEAVAGTNLQISFSIDVTEPTTVLLKQPDGTVYETYSYTGGIIETILTEITGGTWSLEINNSNGDTVITYQVDTKEVPADGCVEGSDFDGDGVEDCAEECPFDPLKTEAGSCGCGSADIDTDTDGSMDCVDADDDNDGMPDEWENANGLNPLYDDADEDKDGDGAKNITEYKRGTDPQDPESYSAKSLPFLFLLLGE